MGQLNQEITSLYKSLKRKEKIAIRLQTLEDLIPQRTVEIEELTITLKKELADVEKLSGTNFYALFQTMLGDKEQQLEIERQEYLDAFLKHKGTVENLTELKAEKAILEQTYSSQFGVEKHLETLLAEKEKLLLRQDHPMTESILMANKNIINHQAKITEIEQAIFEGKRTKKILQKMILDLDQVESWGLNPKNQKRKIKNNQLILRIERNTMKVNKYLQKYEEELADLSLHFKIDFRRQVDTIRNFLDDFVDSLITDWVIKRKISNAAHLVNHIFDKISRINASLAQEVTKTEGFLHLEEEQKQLLLINDTPS